ncbi:MAG TPA: HPr family phosphocarrier protein [Accumulibacter sp.]|uniref:HPr family phosphocarrier protein n=1 Tax=Accumulibacter sp. TaxID=2053492 RepID=UPI00263A3B67|nr:HPr family phosphocarrier protein [Accumulibacter sp.]HMV06454.1 HPr family phosphocarrier protein [Accumulibacter sp.]HMW64155.1 HPr family phosphocarrier protein [Accumulibacter sp.]HMW80546.1 HPr family phosphocarrier protein [Accumulibacter sp.]HMX69345.1 HPr family phosphocarrier protein [Accumulibacter sp.]HNB69019.1 HPr family phosphocarrier protein [Accumulibacter sp.]
MVRAETAIINKLGLHARASAKLTQLAGRFSSEVWMEKGARRINAKSIMGVMMLAAGKGSTVVVETDGADEQAANDAILELIAARFGEAE